MTAPAAGKMAEYTVYTTELKSDLYSFETASSGSYFSDSEDEQHTEKFSVYLMSTAKADWGEYKGTYTADADKDIFFVLSPFSTTFSSASGGNLVDNMSFTDKTRILMIDLSIGETPKYYSYTVNTEINTIPLTDFTALGSTGTNFTVKTGDMLTEKLVFIVDYVDTDM